MSKRQLIGLRTIDHLGICLAILAWSLAYPSSAQLAITEVMALASMDDHGSERSDYWELTNFGTNTIALSGYRWGEEGIPGWNAAELLPLPTTGASIAPGESIVFFRLRAGIPDAMAFREWWGTNLPAGCQLYIWNLRPGGIDEEEGEVKLWDPNGNLVDKAVIRSGRRGISFTYDSTSGAFNVLTAVDINGGFQADVGGDVGSPGVHKLPPVPIQFSLLPTNQSIDAGSSLVLKVQSVGRPQPRFQWYFNDSSIEPVRTASDEVPKMICFAGCGSTWTELPSLSDLVLPKIQPSHAGTYRVRAFNGIDDALSDPIFITVNTNPTPIAVHCPELACPPLEATNNSPGLTITPGQSATFSVFFNGYPEPTFLWSYSPDGKQFYEIAGATNQSFTVSLASFEEQGVYRVRLTNPTGSVIADARLNVRQPAALEITEAMPLDCTLVGRDWWELTNTGDQPESICGYRWDDTVSPLAIGQGVTVQRPVILKPGESVIFLENLTPELFRQWWGESNLPPDLQFVVYTGNGLSSAGDIIYLWNPTAIDPSDIADKATFGTAAPGISFWFDPNSVPAYLGHRSLEGECGAIHAAERCDLGSPGWSRWSRSHLTDIRRDGAVTTLTWRAQAGSRHRLQFTRKLASSTETVWTDLGTYSFSSVTCTATDVVPAAESQRFYRLVAEAPAVCNIPSPDLE